MQMNFLKENAKRFNERIKTQGNHGYVYSWGDFFINSIRYGCSPDDYFRYQFQNKSRSEKNKFITYRRSKKLIKTYNSSDEVSKVLDKVTFNKSYSKFIRREWLDTRVCAFEEFSHFVQKHNNIIVKPVDAGSGVGIWKYTYDGKDDLHSIFSEIRGALIEEVIVQHEVLRKLNPASINTIRVITVTNNNKVNFIACSLRSGLGYGVVDNLHAGGASASVDISSGIVFTPAINAKLEKFLAHPITGEKFIGLSVPNWPEVLKVVEEAALSTQKLKYLGWDIAILQDGVELIEANHDPAHDLIQMVDQIGKYDLIQKHIK